MNNTESWWARSPYPDCDYVNFMNSDEMDEDNIVSGRIRIKIDGDPFIFAYLVEYDEITYGTIIHEHEDFQPECAEYDVPETFKDAKFIAEAFIHKHAKYPWHKGESFYIEKDAEFNKFARALMDQYYNMHL